MKLGLLTAGWLTYLLLLLYGSLMPPDFHADWPIVQQKYQGAFDFWPFGPHHASRSDMVSNFALYVPLGFLTAARWRVTDVDSGKARTATGARLAADGIAIRLPRGGARVLEIEKS